MRENLESTGLHWRTKENGNEEIFGQENGLEPIL